MGGAVAAGFYALNKMLRFENVNPGQDDDGDTTADSVARMLDQRFGKHNEAIEMTSGGARQEEPVRGEMSRQRSYGQRSVHSVADGDQYGLGRPYDQQGRLRTFVDKNSRTSDIV